MVPLGIVCKLLLGSTACWCSYKAKEELRSKHFWPSNLGLARRTCHQATFAAGAVGTLNTMVKWTWHWNPVGAAWNISKLQRIGAMLHGQWDARFACSWS